MAAPPRGTGTGGASESGHPLPGGHCPHTGSSQSLGAPPGRPVKSEPHLASGRPEQRGNGKVYAHFPQKTAAEESGTNHGQEHGFRERPWQPRPRVRAGRRADLASSGGLDPGKVSVLSRKAPEPHSSAWPDNRTGPHRPRESRQWRAAPRGTQSTPTPSRPGLLNPGKRLLRTSLGASHTASLPVSLLSRPDHTQTPSFGATFRGSGGSTVGADHAFLYLSESDYYVELSQGIYGLNFLKGQKELCRCG